MQQQYPCLFIVNANRCMISPVVQEISPDERNCGQTIRTCQTHSNNRNVIRKIYIKIYRVEWHCVICIRAEEIIYCASRVYTDHSEMCMAQRRDNDING
jgi:hypothetical protein